MTLQDLISRLAAADQARVLAQGFGFPRSYRGDYAQLAFPPTPNVAVADMLTHARQAMGKTFTGYKGGEYIAHEYTEVYLASWGECGEEIGPTLLDFMLASGAAYDLVAHLEKQSAFSLRTFGPGPRVLMVLDHIRAELIEIEASPTDVYEWIDVAMLAFDGAWRAGHSPAAIAAALSAKLAKNVARTWPDWRSHDPDRAIKHTPDAPIEAAPSPLIYPEEMSDAIRDVLGRPNFACIQIADLLRASGVEIPSKAEAEQAAVIHFLLKFVLRHGDAWGPAATGALDLMRIRAIAAKGE